ncbi:hypothetical protein CEXT_724811 [Caerostris extrusa]|uniref:Uncharacterized protein n=1 Tax=Caerostris extrusa TaxID=172846 RepID=A0AAV4S635_CAEEX|nr:hypothetical protein CEXT_724811 [Caerostris extrusa]
MFLIIEEEVKAMLDSLLEVIPVSFVVLDIIEVVFKTDVELSGVLVVEIGDATVEVVEIGVEFGGIAVVSVVDIVVKSGFEVVLPVEIVGFVLDDRISVVVIVGVAVVEISGVDVEHQFFGLDFRSRRCL